MYTPYTCAYCRSNLYIYIYIYNTIIILNEIYLNNRITINNTTIYCRLTVQDMSQVGNIPVRIETPPSHATLSPRGSLDGVITVREGASVELPCVGVGLPSPTYRYDKNVA